MRAHRCALFLKHFGGPNKKQTDRIHDGRTWGQLPK
jgi:protein gp37